MKGKFTLVLVLVGLLFGSVMSTSAQATESDTEANKALVLAFIEEVFNEGNVEAAGDYAAPEYIQNTPGAESGLAALQGGVSMFHAAFPDIRYTVTHIGAEGDLVAARLFITGTQDGDFLGMPASGRSVAGSALNFWRVEDGLLVEHWEVVDQFALLQQLGIIPGGVEASSDMVEMTPEPAATETVDVEQNRDENRAIIEALFTDVVNVQAADAAEALVAEDFFWHNLFVAPGLEGFQQFYGVIFEAFPDVERTIDVSVVDGDLVFIYNTITGTHLGGEQLYGVPPTGNSINYTSGDVFRVADGKIVEQWDVADYFTLFQQIGLIPAQQ